MTEELIPLTVSAIGNEEQKTVNARDLHAFLEVKTRFNDWIERRIADFGFVESVDFVSVTQKRVTGGTQTDYFLSLSMAKEIAMVERNAKGKQARLYFIECEKIAKAKAVPTQFQIPQTMQEALRLAADQMDKNAALQLENQKLTDKATTLETKIEADKHKVGFYDDCADTTDLYLGTEVASRLNVKRPFFFNYCFNRGIIQRHNKRWMSTAKYRGKKWVFDVIKPFKHPTTGEQKDGDQLYFSMLGMRGIYDMMKEENVSGLNPQPDLFKGATK